MATRRSARLRKSPTPELVDDQQDASSRSEIEPATVRKVESRERAKKPRKAETNKSEAQNVQRQAGSGNSNATILFLPPEVLSMVMDNVTDLSSISALGRTCKVLCSLVMPRLYGRIAVAAMFHAHIPKLIRTLEPHLTIAQKKQLKKEGKYKGQAERYPTILNEKSKPICAAYVRQLVIGVADPGRKHRYIVDRYVEEALKNMQNLEIVETRIVNKSISQSMASLTSLKALSVFLNDAEAEGMAPLARIKNLKHLSWQDYGWSFDKPAVMQSVLRNSTSTLQSLAIETNEYARQFLEYWGTISQASGLTTLSETRATKHDFTALKSLSLSGVRIDEDFIREFQKAIDFPQLRELRLTSLRDPQCLLHPYLTSVVTLRQGTTEVPVSLRTLSIDMSDDDFRDSAEQQKALFEAKCAFMSSFDSLTNLELPKYGQYKPDNTTNPGLSHALLMAIIQHKNLRVLRISYQGRISGWEIPYLDAETVGTIVDGLPHLREFEFAPEEEQMKEIGQSLLRGSHLESITCFPHATWGVYPRPDEPGVNIVSSILSAFLSSTKINPTSTVRSGNFVWEGHYKLKQVSVIYKTWDIASEFGKREKRAAKPERIRIIKADGAREVCYRPTIETRRIHVGYDPEFEWVAKVDRELN